MVIEDGIAVMVILGLALAFTSAIIWIAQNPEYRLAQEIHRVARSGSNSDFQTLYQEWLRKNAGPWPLSLADPEEVGMLFARIIDLGNINCEEDFRPLFAYVEKIRKDREALSSFSLGLATRRKSAEKFRRMYEIQAAQGSFPKE